MTKWLLMLLIFTLGCNFNSYRISDKERQANANLTKVSRDLCKKYDLKPFGSGGQMMDQIKMLHLGFAYRKSLSIDEARHMIVDCVHEFAKTINEDEKIRPYLGNYPFASRNIQLEIFLQDESGRSVSNGLLLVTANRGKIKYKIRDPFSEGHLTIFEETIEQAEKNLIAQSS